MKKVSRTELARAVASSLLEGKDRDQLMKQVAAYLIDHNMTSQMNMFLDDLAVELETRTGHATATVTVAHTLAAENQKSLEAYVKEATGAESIELTIEEDPSILGGVIIRTPEHEYDASVRHKINQLARGEA